MQPIKYSILVVDDTVDVLHNLEEYLLMDGYNVFTAQNGILALEVMQNNKLDLIITDLLMPEMDGLELIQEVRKDPKNRAIPILIFSARPLHENAVAADLGADAFILKPSAVEVISDVVAQLLQEKLTTRSI